MESAAKRHDTKRHETLADGVFAIVMTLLVLELSIPVITEGSEHSGLFPRLIEMWPEFVTFGVSFLILGLFWGHHTTLFRSITHGGGRLFWLNLFFLMFVSLVPFSASIVGEYWAEPAAAVLYGLNMLIPFLLAQVLFAHARKHQLVDTTIEHLAAREETVAGVVGILIIIIGMCLSMISTGLSFLVYGLLSAFYIINGLMEREGLAAKKIKL